MNANQQMRFWSRGHFQKTKDETTNKNGHYLVTVWSPGIKKPLELPLSG